MGAAGVAWNEKQPPISPPAGSTQWLFQGPPAERKFLPFLVSGASMTVAGLPEFYGIMTVDSFMAVSLR